MGDLTLSESRTFWKRARLPKKNKKARRTARKKKDASQSAKRREAFLAKVREIERTDPFYDPLDEFAEWLGNMPEKQRFSVLGEAVERTK